MSFRTRVNHQPFTLVGCATIDKSQDDQRHYLKAARHFLRAKTSITPAAHSTRTTAALKLLQCQGGATAGATPELNVIGHGRVGLTITGSGSHDPASTEQYVGNGNRADWIKQSNLGKLGQRSTVVRLCSCDTGADADGLTFLTDLANATGATVKAPTGLIYCDDRGFFFGSTTHWQSVAPAAPPLAPGAPVQPIPLSVEYVTNPHMNMIVLWEGNGLIRVPVAAVERVTLSLLHPLDKRPLGAPAAPWSVDGDRARDAVTAVQFDDPILDMPSVAAMQTGTLTVTFTSGVKQRVRTFQVLNERLLRDVDAPHVFYFADRDGLRAALGLPPAHR